MEHKFGLILLLAFPFHAVAADAIQGKILYQSKCLRCHRADTMPLTLAPAKIPDVLRTKPIHAHRFVITDAELDDIVAYLEAVEVHP